MDDQTRAALAKANDRKVRKAIRQHEALVAAWRADWVRQVFPPLPSPSLRERDSFGA